MRFLLRLLVVLLVLAAAVAAAELLHPKGVGGLYEDWVRPAPASPAPPSATSPVAATPQPAPPPPAPAPAAPVEVWGPGAAQVLGWADRDYDRGDFDGAYANYLTSKPLSANAEERRRALQGMERAILAWGLVRGAAHVSGKPAALDAEYRTRLAAAEAAPTEEAWVDLARWTSGAGLRDRLPHVVGQALDAARAGGAVERTLRASADASPGRRDALVAAMSARGIDAPAAPAPTASSSAPSRTAANETPPAPTWRPPAPGPDDDSGIGGVNERGIPFGRFSATTRGKLRRAVKLEREGTNAYRKATPDDRNRVENRHAAMNALKQARDIYLEAQQEDPDSRDLEERLKDVMRMLAELRKDEGISER